MTGARTVSVPSLPAALPCRSMIEPGCRSMVPQATPAFSYI